MDSYKIMDSIINIFRVEGYSTIADDLSSTKDNSCSAGEIHASFTFKVREILSQNPGLNPELNKLCTDLIKYCYSIGLITN
jgi:transposase